MFLIHLITNYLGWFFTVYIFFQLFALYVHFRQPGKVESATLPRWYYAQAVTTHAIAGSVFILNDLSGSNKAVTDATGAVW